MRSLPSWFFENSSLAWPTLRREAGPGERGAADGHAAIRIPLHLDYIPRA